MKVQDLLLENRDEIIKGLDMFAEYFAARHWDIKKNYSGTSPTATFKKRGKGELFVMYVGDADWRPGFRVYKAGSSAIASDYYPEHVLKYLEHNFPSLVKNSPPAKERAPKSGGIDASMFADDENYKKIAEKYPVTTDNTKIIVKVEEKDGPFKTSFNVLIYNNGYVRGQREGADRLSVIHKGVHIRKGDRAKLSIIADDDDDDDEGIFKNLLDRLPGFAEGLAFAAQWLEKREKRAEKRASKG